LLEDIIKILRDVDNSVSGNLPRETTLRLRERASHGGF